MAAVTYNLHEVILCRSRLSIESWGYPAKIMEIKVEDGVKQYLIHYTGWNVRFDVWINDDDTDYMFFKYTAELAAEHKRLYVESKKAAAAAEKEKKKKDTPTRPAKRREGSTSSRASLSRAPSVKSKSVVVRERERREREDRSRSSSQSTSGMPILDDQRIGHEDLVVKMPDQLSAVLLDDKTLVINQNRLVKLPARFTVDKIMAEYQQAISRNEDIPEIAGDDNRTVLNKHDMMRSSIGVVDYFNGLLGKQLLYENEEAQYARACVTPPAGAKGRKVDIEDTPELEDMKIVPSSVYGFVHLVRLFVHFDRYIAQGGFGDSSIRILSEHISDLLAFLTKNANKFHDINKDYTATVKTERLA